MNGYIINTDPHWLSFLFNNEGWSSEMSGYVST